MPYQRMLPPSRAALHLNHAMLNRCDMNKDPEPTSVAMVDGKLMQRDFLPDLFCASDEDGAPGREVAAKQLDNCRLMVKATWFGKVKGKNRYGPCIVAGFNNFDCRKMIISEVYPLRWPTVAIYQTMRRSVKTLDKLFDSELGTYIIADTEVLGNQLGAVVGWEGKDTPTLTTMSVAVAYRYLLACKKGCRVGFEAVERAWKTNYGDTL